MNLVCVNYATYLKTTSFVKTGVRTITDGRRWLMKRHFKEMPILDDFEMVSETLKPLKSNEIMLKPEFWSVDPYARIYPISFGYKMPMTMLGSQVAQVLESKNSKYPEGSHVVTYTGWRDVSIVDPDAVYDTYGKVLGIAQRRLFSRHTHSRDKVLCPK